jgi:hypothetical protein
MNLYKGIVVSTDVDDEKRGIIKCTIDGLFNSDNNGNIDESLLPKLYPIYPQDSNSFDSPKKGEEVYVFFDRGTKYNGFWIGKYSLSPEFLALLGDRYEGFKSIKFDEEEKLRCYYSRDRGLVLELDESRVEIKENEIKLVTPDRIIHIKNGMISLGSTEKSAEPATLGDKNVDALNEISDEISSIGEAIIKFCATQSAVTKSVSFLAPLTAGYDPLLASVTLSLGKIKGKIKGITIPATKSNKTSLD